MSAQFAGTGDYFQPALEPIVQRAVHDLNRDYVELLANVDTDDSELPHLPRGVQESLQNLAPAARERLAQAPFTLFSLGLCATEFWYAVAQHWAATSLSARYVVRPSGLDIGTAFTEITLPFVWHVARSQPLAARVLFGMNDGVIAAFQMLTLWQLRRVARDYPGLLSPRWAQNPFFWPELIRGAAGQPRQLETAQLLGTQLMAAEVEPDVLARCARTSARRRKRQY